MALKPLLVLPSLSEDKVTAQPDTEFRVRWNVGPTATRPPCAPHLLPQSLLWAGLLGASPGPPAGERESRDGVPIGGSLPQSRWLSGLALGTGLLGLQPGWGSHTSRWLSHHWGLLPRAAARERGFRVCAEHP